MSNDPSNPPQLSTVPLFGAAVNASLAMLKILAGVFGNSYALIADGIESTSDIVTSLVVWGGLRVAITPADEKHPYGYGKAEALAGIVAALALLSAAVIIAIQSVREILTPHHLPHWSTLIVLILVVAIKESLARWVGKIGAEVESTSIQADAWHHRSDALTSVAAFLGITIGLVGGPAMNRRMIGRLWELASSLRIAASDCCRWPSGIYLTHRPQSVLRSRCESLP